MPLCPWVAITPFVPFFLNPTSGIREGKSGHDAHMMEDSDVYDHGMPDLTGHWYWRWETGALGWVSSGVDKFVLE